MTKKLSKPTPTQKNVLVVEGQDDLYSLATLLKYHLQIDHIESVINIREQKGYENLYNGLINLFQASGLERIGIVVDADTDKAARWQSIQAKLVELKSLGFQFNDVELNANGTIFTADYLGQPLTIGVWIMPNNQQNGMLEDFLATLIAENDPLWTHAKDCVAQIPDTHRHFRPSYQSKAEIYTWLAWQEEPGKPFGQAITKKILNPESINAQALMQWLRQLFNL